MFHPVGSQPPAIYWRRRLFIVGAIIAILVLAALTISAFSGGDNTGLAGGTPTSGPSTPKPVSSPTKRTTPTHTQSSADQSSSTNPNNVPKACKSSNLQVAAVVGSTTYSVGASPVVELRVTNTGSGPCIQDLADKQIELQVYNGSSRVWGSHDCAIQPGVDKRTLAVGQPYISSVVWGGLSSNKGCTGQRQRIGAGRYTLYALLAGKKGTPATFTIS